MRPISTYLTQPKEGFSSLTSAWIPFPNLEGSPPLTWPPSLSSRGVPLPNLRRVPNFFCEILKGNVILALLIGRSDPACRWPVDLIKNMKYFFSQVAELENEIETLRNELRDKELRMQSDLKEVQSFWQSKLFQEKESHNLETNALKEALKILRRQMNPPTLSWSSSSTTTATNVRNKFRSEEEEVGHDCDDLNGDGCNLVSTGLMVVKPVCDAWTQVPGVSGNPSEALSSVALAYQVSLITF